MPSRRILQLSHGFERDRQPAPRLPVQPSDGLCNQLPRRPVSARPYMKASDSNLQLRKLLHVTPHRAFLKSKGPFILGDCAVKVSRFYERCSQAC
jgi:hypothetical protein